MRIAFYCVTPAPVGGATPIVDVRAVMRELDERVADAFRSKGLRYVRNFSDGIHPTWQEFFHTEDRSVVERMCREAESEFEWRGRDRLCVRRRAQAVARHPRTGEEVFFNQVQLHHVACLDEQTREAMLLLYDVDELPRNVTYGDGSPISDETMAHVNDVYERLAVRFDWRAGDMVVLDNMLAAHARDPFQGERKILVALARMQSSTMSPSG